MNFRQSPLTGLSKKNIYLLGYAGSYLQRAGSNLCCSMQDISCGMWDLVPQLGLEPRPPTMGAQGLRPPGKSLTCFLQYFLQSFIVNSLMYLIIYTKEKPASLSTFSLRGIWAVCWLLRLSFTMPTICSSLCEWVKVAWSCVTLCDPMDCSLWGSSVHGDSPGKNTGVGCHALLQGIFPTQGSNPGLPHRGWIL